MSDGEQIEVAELIGSNYRVDRAGKATTWSQKYYVYNTDDKDEAVDALVEAVEMSPLIRNGLAIIVADSIEIEDIADEQWMASIEFVTPEARSGNSQPKQVGECTFAFDGTGGRVVIKQAYSQVKYGANAPFHDGAINVIDGVAEGCEIVVPSLNFTITQKFEGATITLPWLRQICLATGTANVDKFLGFEPGEVLFLGPSGSQPFAFMSDGKVEFGEREVEFRFAVSPNLKNLTIGDITGIDKDGHDYLWIEYRPEEDDTDDPKGVTATPIGVYVAQVYRRTPFALLGVNDPSKNYPVA